MLLLLVGWWVQLWYVDLDLIDHFELSAVLDVQRPALGLMVDAVLRVADGDGVSEYVQAGSAEQALSYGGVDGVAYLVEVVEVVDVVPGRAVLEGVLVDGALAAGGGMQLAHDEGECRGKEAETEAGVSYERISQPAAVKGRQKLARTRQVRDVRCNSCESTVRQYEQHQNGPTERTAISPVSLQW